MNQNRSLINPGVRPGVKGATCRRLCLVKISKIIYIYIYCTDSIFLFKNQNLEEGANENLRDGEFTPFRNHLAPFGRPRHMFFYPFKAGHFMLLFFWGTVSIDLCRVQRFETRKGRSLT